MLRIAIVLTLLVSSVSWAFEEKPALTVVALEMPSYAEQNGKGVYWDILKAIFASEVKLQLIAATPAEYQRYLDNKAADIFVSTQAHKSPQLIYSDQHIDIKHAVYLLGMDEQFDHSRLSQLIIAARKDQYLQSLLPNKNTIYQLESIENIHQLIKRKRVDAALVYSFNLIVYMPLLVSHIL